MHSSMARALELKRMLTNIKKSATQTMDSYLPEIKTIVDNLATVNSLVPSSDLIHYTLLGLGREYETLVTTLTHTPLQITFDDLRPRLLLHEQRLRHLDGDDVLAHPALVSHSTGGSASSQSLSSSHRSTNNGHHSSTNNRGGGHWCNNRHRTHRGGG